jgi:hypothetical protein
MVKVQKIINTKYCNFIWELCSRCSANSRQFCLLVNSNSMNHTSSPQVNSFTQKLQSFAGFCATQFMNMMGTSIFKVALPGSPIKSYRKQVGPTIHINPVNIISIRRCPVESNRRRPFLAKEGRFSRIKPHQANRND